ncbi:type 4a pilus biogenesis protein PilO [Halomonas denitrificans]|uniref:type 4a pilus biogenesis protein PilO n=1 Tax=Halomonas denitrificans TaxID=370769 RepID=UPI001CD67931|nr:type 4a pilus biogenesis protein PilO [Halomonas denitrificans]MCA0976015.1 type 4a pilus biogenesis protein PilO [Halomonas denitrificans]
MMPSLDRRRAVGHGADAIAGVPSSRSRWLRLREEWRRLGVVDWRRLELGEAGRWPWMLRVLVGSSAFCVALVVTLVCYVRPLAIRLEQLELQEQQAIGEFEARARELAELDRMKRVLVNLDQMVSERRQMLPDGADIPSLLEGIGDEARARGLALQELALGQPRPLALYVERPFELRVRGGYHAIGGFIADLANLPRLVTIHDFSLLPVEGQLELRARVQTYSIGDASAAAVRVSDEQVRRQ